jgi:O-antigen ligase
MKMCPVYLHVLIALGSTAITLPIFGGYFVALQLLVWLVVAGPWRRGAPTGSVGDPVFDRAYASVVRPIHGGVVLMLIAQLVAALVAWSASPYAKPLGKTLGELVHTSLKLGLLWFVLAAGLKAAWDRRWPPQRAIPWLTLWLAVLLVYCIAQRYTGIDWTHGFDAVLGPHRFAYGVYRVSGFMGHPLTFGYNLVLLVLAVSALAWCHGAGLGPLDRRACWVAGALSIAILGISGSRFPLAALVCSWAVVERRRFLRHWRWILGAGVVVAAALWLEGSMLGRMTELFDPGIPIEQRFPRVVYWQVHWRMFLENPIAGVGRAGLSSAYEHYYEGVTLFEKVYIAHNIYLQTLAETGVIGFLGLGALLAGLVVAARRCGPRSGLAYLVAGVMISGLMQNNLRDSEFLYALWYLAGVLALHGAGRRAELAGAG